MICLKKIKPTTDTVTKTFGLHFLIPCTGTKKTQWHDCSKLKHVFVFRVSRSGQLPEKEGYINACSVYYAVPEHINQH